MSFLNKGKKGPEWVKKKQNGANMVQIGPSGATMG
jgi:hypothetical protein